ncbi:MAG: TonB family protein [Bryobacteraceae bacterium]
MPAHADILDQPERLGKGFVRSLALHLAVFAVIVLTPLIPVSRKQPWGSPMGGGGSGAIAVNVVGKIPLPGLSGRVNPVANDTESQAPAPPPASKAQRKTRAPEPDAIPLKSRNAPNRPIPQSTSTNRWRASQQDARNQMYSSAGQALVSPLVGQAGSGGVGIGSGTPFGARLGNYALILKQTVARNWNTSDIDPRIRTAPPVIVSFVLLRNGQVRNVRVTQRSGNGLLDMSAQRAIFDSAPFPPIPSDYEGNEATIEFWFYLNR